MEFGEMKRNTSNWRNFCMLLRRAGFDSVSWAFLFIFNREYLENGSWYG